MSRNDGFVHPVPFGPVQYFTPMQPNQPPRPFYGTCYICQQTGHIANNCPYATGPVRGGGSAKRGGPKRHGKKR